MPSGPRNNVNKRSAEIDSMEQQKRDKKRAQNRRAQQCYREKQAARMKQLAEMVQELESSSTTEAKDGRSQLELLKENQSLRESLLRMRKSLLSLSSAASFSADDEIFKRILDKSKDDKPQTAAIEPSPRASSVDATSPWYAFDLPETLNAPNPGDHFSSALEPDSSEPAAHKHYGFLESSDLLEKMLRPTATITNLPSPHVLSPDIQQPPAYSDEHFISPSLPHPDTNSGNNIPLRESDEPLLSISNPLSSNPFVTGSPLLALESTIKEVIATMKFNSLRERLGIPQSPFCLSPEQAEVFDSQTREGIISFAVRVMLKSTPLGGYVRVMDYSALVESIIQWRIHPSSENRAKIPQPFRPTVLQTRFRDHHPAIDFLFNGDLRDQLLLHMDYVDMDKLGFDCVKSIVREYPEFGVALPVLDTFAHMANAEVALSGGATGFNYLQDIKYGVREESITQNLIDKVRKYCLDKMCDRKLSPTFEKAYPFLDLSNIVTKLPVVDYRSIEFAF